MATSQTSPSDEHEDEDEGSIVNRVARRRENATAARVWLTILGLTALVLVSGAVGARLFPVRIPAKEAEIVKPAFTAQREKVDTVLTQVETQVKELRESLSGMQSEYDALEEQRTDLKEKLELIEKAKALFSDGK